MRQFNFQSYKTIQESQYIKTNFLSDLEEIYIQFNFKTGILNFETIRKTVRKILEINSSRDLNFS